MTTTDVRPLFKENVRLTCLTEYGFTMQDLIQGKEAIPQQGARFDINFEGNVTGERIRGTIKGTDYLEVRPDRRFCLNLQACITTDDGAHIKVVETGTNDQGDLKLYMSFYTNDERYTWLNHKQVLGLGHVDFATGMVKVQGYLI